MCTVPWPYSKEFGHDVVRVARNREPDVHLKQIAADFGISESCLTWGASPTGSRALMSRTASSPGAPRPFRAST